MNSSYKLTSARLRRLSFRHWNKIGGKELNALRELLERLEHSVLEENLSQSKTASHFVPNFKSEKNAKTYARIEDDGRERVTVTDAFGRNHSFFY